jgi:hypothetical protein
MVLAALATILLTAACDTGIGPTATPPSSHGGPVHDQPSLIDALREAGFRVNPVANIQRPFLSGSGNSVQVDGETIEVFEYADENGAKSDAAKIQPNGTVPGTSVTWSATPHFYQKGRIIVIYAGTDQKVLSALESALGKPFATGP